MCFWKFIAVVGIIFFLERILPFFIPFSAAIFPAFFIVFLFFSKNIWHDLIMILIVAVLFDLFSGFTFGYFTMALALVGITMYFIKKRLMMLSESYLFGLIFVLIFIIEFLAIHLIKLSLSHILERLLINLAEGAIVYSFAFVILERNAQSQSKI